ncbi:hypothetical protein NL676_031438 [Syzygium grande]|nr:hypothetical protein NL676_031438 [Syzygium grande]
MERRSEIRGSFLRQAIETAAEAGGDPSTSERWRSVRARAKCRGGRAERPESRVKLTDSQASEERKTTPEYANTLYECDCTLRVFRNRRDKIPNEMSEGGNRSSEASSPPGKPDISTVHSGGWGGGDKIGLGRRESDGRTFSPWRRRKTIRKQNTVRR